MGHKATLKLKAREYEFILFWSCDKIKITKEGVIVYKDEKNVTPLSDTNIISWDEILEIEIEKEKDNENSL